MNITPHVTTGGIIDFLDDIIQTKPLSISNNTNQLETSVNIDYTSHFFATSRKHKHSDTEPSANNNVSYHIPLGYYPMQFNKKTTTTMMHQKSPTSVNDFFV